MACMLTKKKSAWQDREKGTLKPRRTQQPMGLTPLLPHPPQSRYEAEHHVHTALD